MGEYEARTQGALVLASTSATEDAASCRPARSGGAWLSSSRAPKGPMREVGPGIFQLDAGRIEHFFPHLAAGDTYAVSDISIANGMETTRREVRRRWRRPDGELELIVYPPAPTIADLQ